MSKLHECYEKIDSPNGCWIWQKSLSSNGYGLSRRSSYLKVQYAHRVVYEDLKGSIKHGTELDHLCRNRACVNPDHLEAVSRTINTHRGSKSKLTLEQASEIRKLRAAGSCPRSLAVRFGVSKTTIYAVVTNLSWKEEDLCQK